MPRAKRRTLALVLAEHAALEARLEAVKKEAEYLSKQSDQEPGSTVSFRLKGAVVSGVIGSRRGDIEQADVEYFVYVDRKDGFGADGHIVPWYDIIVAEEPETLKEVESE